MPVKREVLRNKNINLEYVKHEKIKLYQRKVVAIGSVALPG